MPNQGQFVRRTATVLLACVLILGLLPGCADRAPNGKFAASIVPLDGPVLAGKPVTFRLNGNPKNAHWELGDGATADGSSVNHTYQEPGIYRVVMGSKVGDTFNELSSAIVRVHTPETVHLPQVLLDTDAANEIDDQHAIAYALFSELDILAINSVNHMSWRDNTQTVLYVPGADPELNNYNEILRVIDLAKQSGLPASRVPMVFRGAKTPMRYLGLTEDKWFDTPPVVTDASNAILAAARGASPDNPVWVLPVGPLGNVATALLQVRQQGWTNEFSRRIRICWLGGGPGGARLGGNGGHAPWEPWVTYKASAESGTEFVMFMENPTGLSITCALNRELSYFPNNPLGNYLKKRVTEYPYKWNNGTEWVLYDIGPLALVIGEHLGRSWLRRVEPSILGSQTPYPIQPTAGPTNLKVVREVNVPAIKKDFWDTLNGKPTPLPQKRQN